MSLKNLSHLLIFFFVFFNHKNILIYLHLLYVYYIYTKPLEHGFVDKQLFFRILIERKQK